MFMLAASPIFNCLSMKVIRNEETRAYENKTAVIEDFQLKPAIQLYPGQSKLKAAVICRWLSDRFPLIVLIGARRYRHQLTAVCVRQLCFEIASLGSLMITNNKLTFSCVCGQHIQQAVELINAHVNFALLDRCLCMLHVGGQLFLLLLLALLF